MPAPQAPAATDPRPGSTDGREFTRPRPYTLADLAEASGMSISGVRTCYDHDQVAAVTQQIDRPSRDWRASDPSGPPDLPAPSEQP